jgi:hypothetical protein
LATDEVRVDDRQRRVGCARREHRLAFEQTAGVVGRCIEVHHDFGAARGLGRDRSVRAPRVFADRHADLHTVDHEQRAGIFARREVALLVEHRVVRQEVLAIDAVHAALRAHRRRVVEVAADLREAHDRRAPTGARRDLLERLVRVRDERGPEQQVFGRIPGDRELRVDDEIAAGRFRGFVGGEDAIDVALEVADDDVDLGSRDSQPGHGSRIRAGFARATLPIDSRAIPSAPGSRA